MERPRAVVLIFLILFFLFSPDTTQPSRGQKKRLENRKSKDDQALEQLRHSSYGHLPFLSRHPPQKNDTSPVADGDFSSSLLSNILSKARTQYLELFSNTDKVSEEDILAGSEAAYAGAVEVLLPFYQNVSGIIDGDFTRCSLDTNISTHDNYTESTLDHRNNGRDYSKNITEDDGGLTIELYEEDKGTATGDAVREISAHVTIRTDSSPGTGWMIKMYGVHYLKTGSIILTTTSDKFSGIFTLPDFARTEAEFSQSKELLNKSLSEMILDREKRTDDRASLGSHISSEDGASFFSASSCEFVVYLQQYPVPFQSLNIDTHEAMELIKRIEDELRFPKGAPLPEVSPMTFTSLVFSPDCGFVLESTSHSNSKKAQFLFGPKTETLSGLIRHLIFALLIVLGLQISLLKRQMDEASTPSTRSRTSYYSIAIMAMGDGLMLSTLLTFAMLRETSFLILASTSFLCFFNFAFFEMKFIYDIWLVQVGDSRRDEPQPLGPGRASASNESPADSAGLPAPVTASQPTDTGATTIILPPDQDIEAAAEEDARQGAEATGGNTLNRNRADFQTLYSRFYCTMVVLGFFSVWTMTWSKSLRSVYVNVLCFAYLSFWIPQIHRNAMRNCRQAFTWEYVIGISILRLLPVMYCYMKRSSVLYFDTDPLAAAILAAWVSLQVLALAVQQLLGPRLFVKESWCPPAYDYHPLLHVGDSDVESGSLLPIGFVASASEAKDMINAKREDSASNFKVFDCAICMNEIQVPVVDSGDAADKGHYGAGLLRRRNYMVTPCRHIFHTECLEGWMRFRLVCPICRESLPPL